MIKTSNAWFNFKQASCSQTFYHYYALSIFLRNKQTKSSKHFEANDLWPHFCCNITESFISKKYVPYLSKLKFMNLLRNFMNLIQRAWFCYNLSYVLQLQAFGDCFIRVFTVGVFSLKGPTKLVHAIDSIMLLKHPSTHHHHHYYNVCSYSHASKAWWISELLQLNGF